MTAPVRHPFFDPLSRHRVVLVIGGDRETTGIEHADIEWQERGGSPVSVGCDRLADVTPELDSAYCPRCRWQTRISGAWFMDMWHQEHPRDAEPAPTPCATGPDHCVDDLCHGQDVGLCGALSDRMLGIRDDDDDDDDFYDNEAYMECDT